ncbi:hypothetical protein JTE90_005853 [Oedothorax gibbosus]|uniref:E3 ubiquitin-protein ligase APD1-4 middle domain-containing protein n=1 Tax=Oedothorax gibbosus TaxID=931172 RepID=A0AAV6URT6_9ARAC|nr:hypothetical protein JTE90_005853 [Oedothorax gibbosus]
MSDDCRRVSSYSYLDILPLLFAIAFSKTSIVGGDMSSERRVSGWFVLSAVFLVAVFGLFFTFTERKSWPEQRTELAAADMKLAPAASTLWCEAVALKSDHPFVAYQVSEAPSINPKHLNRQVINLKNLKLQGGGLRNSFKLKYYLLKSSVIEIYACATVPGARLLVFQGEKDLPSYLDYLLHSIKDSDSSESGSLNDSSEEEPSYANCNHSKAINSYTDWSTTKCQSLVSNTEIPVDEGENVASSCEGFLDLRRVRVNITSTDFYVISVVGTDHHRATNSIGMRIIIDRSNYSFHKSGLTFDMCSLSTDCTIGLPFGSSDRALILIPDETDAGRKTYVVRSQCKPRLAVFAILSVFFPLVIFIAVAFVVRADRERIMQRMHRGTRTTRTPEEGCRTVAAPLLDTAASGACTVARCEDAVDELPPPYHSLYEAPPPYACVKQEGNK